MENAFTFLDISKMLEIHFQIKKNFKKVYWKLQENLKVWPKKCIAFFFRIKNRECSKIVNLSMKQKIRKLKKIISIMIAMKSIVNTQKVSILKDPHQDRIRYLKWPTIQAIKEQNVLIQDQTL